MDAGEVELGCRGSRARRAGAGENARAADAPAGSSQLDRTRLPAAVAGGGRDGSLGLDSPPSAFSTVAAGDVAGRLRQARSTRSSCRPGWAVRRAWVWSSTEGGCPYSPARSSRTVTSCPSPPLSSSLRAVGLPARAPKPCPAPALSPFPSLPSPPTAALPALAGRRLSPLPARAAISRIRSLGKTSRRRPSIPSPLPAAGVPTWSVPPPPPLSRRSGPLSDRRHRPSSHEQEPSPFEVRPPHPASSRWQGCPPTRRPPARPTC